MRKFIFAAFLVVTAHIQLGAQQQNTKSSTISQPIFISIEGEKHKPPYLEIKNCYFKDSDSNLIIDADETTFIHFDLFNTGIGSGEELELSIDELNNISGLNFQKSLKLPDIKPGEKQHFTIPVIGLSNIKNGLAIFTFFVKEKYGFHSDTFKIEIATAAFKQPKILVTDYLVSSQNGAILEKRRPFDLQLLVQNLGQGTAKNVLVKMLFPLNVFCISANENETIGNLAPGEKRVLNYSLVTNNEFSYPSIELDILITEMYAKYSVNKKIELELNQKISDQKLIVESVGNKEQPKIEVGYLQSDVDRNIPEVALKIEKKVALIIGNENYTGFNSEISVDYAKRDADFFRTYAIKTLGLLEKNVFFLTNTTSANMNRHIDLVTELVKRMGSDTELIFYYAGHGYPDIDNKSPYLMPIDVNSSNLNSAISLKDLYKKLSETNAKKITVIIDACFSGGGRNQGLLTARSVRIQPKEESAMGNMVVFSASKGEQTALPFPSQKHGLFTYFLLKKLQESKGAVSYGELFDYLKNMVGVESIRSMGQSQDPTIKYGTNLNETWSKLQF